LWQAGEEKDRRDRRRGRGVRTDKNREGLVKGKR